MFAVCCLLCCALLRMLLFRSDYPSCSTLSGDITYNQLLVSSVLYCDTIVHPSVVRAVYRYSTST
jgi:hypothetical protein